MKLKLPLLLGAALASFPLLPSFAADAPKKLLLVTTTLGFRHSSIATAEKIIAKLAAESGAFTIDLVQQPPDKPNQPRHATPLKPDASDKDKAAFAATEAKFKEESATYSAAFAAWNEKLKEALTKLSPENLKNYDGVIFANTTGDLPIPDKDGFLAWIKSGKAFIGMHSCSDTFHGWPAFIDMLGGEFKTHGPQVCVECMNEDRQHAANVHLDKSWTLTQEEIYQFKNYESNRVHELLTLSKHPDPRIATAGHFPVSWCHAYGQGRVFYTSLGHREDIWDADPAIKDRKNSVDISKAYQAHILGGIKWALGLAPGDATPQIK